MNNKKAKDDETEDNYEVEVILDRKVIENKVHYLLKWTGYSDEFNTWEPEEFVYCKELIEDYLRRPEQILAATEHNGDLAFIVQTNSRRAELLPAALAYKQCPQLALAFLQRRLVWDAHGDAAHLLAASDQVLRKMRHKLGARGESFAELSPAAIIGALNTSEGVVFMMKWRETEQFDLIPAARAHLQFPKHVFEFYEEKLKWDDDDASAVDG